MESILCRSNMSIVLHMPMFRLVRTMIKLEDRSASSVRWFANSHTVLLIGLNNVQ